MSDVHNMIEVTIDKSVLTEANYIEHEHVQDESMGESECIDSKFIWKQAMADKFNSSLSVNMVDELTKDLDIILDNPTTCMLGDDTIHTLNQRLFDVLNNAAKDCKLNRTNNRSYNGVHKKDCNRKWFDSDCKQERKFYGKAKYKYGKCKTNENLQQLRQASKSYKKRVNVSVKKFQKKFNQKL